MKTSFLKIFLLATFFLLPSFVLAAPSVSGVSGIVVNSQPLTISGSGFGTHSDYGSSKTFGGRTYLNTTYKNFDDGLTGQGWWWDDHGTDNSLWGLVMTNPRRAGHQYYSKWTDASHGELGTLSLNQVGTTGQYFISSWFMVPENCQSGKPFRMYSANQYGVTLFVGGANDYTLRGSGYDSMLNEVQWGSPDLFVPNQWTRVDWLIDQNNNGTVSAYINGNLEWTRINWVDNPFNGDGHTIDLGNMIDDMSRGNGVAGSYNYDDVFVDYTFARVEICSGSTWAVRGHCEVQIPNSWFATSISVTINQGTLSGNNYLYVLDSVNLANVNGFPITFDSGSFDVTPPASPEGLSVN